MIRKPIFSYKRMWHTKLGTEPSTIQFVLGHPSRAPLVINREIEKKVGPRR